VVKRNELKMKVFSLSRPFRKSSGLPLLLVGVLSVLVLTTACGDGDDGPDVQVPTIPGGEQSIPSGQGTIIKPSTLAPTQDKVGSTSGDADAGGVQLGDTVLVHYRGTLDTGEVFDASLGREPLSFIMGTGQLIPGFEDAVYGLVVGESITVRILSERAYGERNEDLLLELPAEGAPANLQVGDRIELANGLPVTVLEITPEVIRLDGNHPLAGEALTFEIEVVDIQ